MSEAEDFHQVLEGKFPNMKAMKAAPTLFSFNGFGLRMAGKRAFDSETSTYIKTHCLTALFVPIFTLGAYRVADAPGGGWYFLGKEEKGSFAKLWNLLVVAAIAGTIGMGMWTSHKNSPGYLADRAIEKASAEVDSGNHLQAAKTYRSMLTDSLPRAEEAKSAMREALVAALGSEDPKQALDAVAFSCRLPSSLISEGREFAEIPTKVEFTVKRVAEKHPAVALEMLDSLQRLPVAPADLSDRRLELLLRLVKEQPDESEHSVTLAGILEENGEIDEAYAVLEPHIDGLGSGDGARILGQILLARGQAAKAIPLLESYIEPRLKTWRMAEKNYESAAERAYQKVVDRLNRGEGPPKFFTQYEAAKNEEEQGKIVDEFVYGQIPGDPDYRQAVEAYERTSKIIPVLMDLGISELQAAQSAADAGQRKQLLDKAEQHFLSLQSSAGDSAEFKFFLGQVYYWSGRQDEGRAQFDELLESSGRDVDTLVTLASTLREIGNVPEAKKLAEEAFEKGKDDEQRSGAAGLLSVIVEDIDEEIKWLEKVKSSDLQHTTRLARAYAEKARNDGDDEEAVRQLRIAEKGWEKLPVTSASMNNGALVQFEIFGLTGDVSAYENGSRMMERGVTLAPDNSILLGNASSSLATTAIMQAVEGKLHPRIIQEGVGFDQLRFLYKDSESRAPFVNAIRNNDNFRRSLELLDRALILAPNRAELYNASLAYRNFIEDDEGMRRLFTQLDAARFDTSQEVEEYDSYLRGDDDEKLLEGKMTALEGSKAVLEAIEDVDQRRHVEVSRSSQRMSLFAIGDVADVDHELAILREALAAHDCMAYSSALGTALAQKAVLGLADVDSDFRKLLESCRRYVSANDLLALALTSETLRPKVLADAAASEFFAWLMEYDERFPNKRSAESVIVTQHVAPDRLAEVRQRFSENRTSQISLKIGNALAPSNPASVMANYFQAMAQGSEAGAKVLLKEAKDKGILAPAL